MNLSESKYKGWEVDETLHSAFVDFEEFLKTGSGKIVLDHLMKVSLATMELGLLDGNGNVVSADDIMNRQRWMREIEKVLNSTPVKMQDEEGE